jgi:hypothetical protein
MAHNSPINRIAPGDNLAPRLVSQLLGVPEATLATWRCTGRVKLPYFKIGGHVRYRASDIEAFIAANMKGGSAL